MLQFGSAAFSLMLAREGWYPSSNLPLGIVSNAATLLSERDEEGNTMLATYFRGETESIAHGLRTSHAERKEEIAQAIQAHAEGAYWLSVPCFLILAEAIAKDSSLPSPYSKTGDKVKLIRDALLSKEELRTAVAFISPLLVSVPIDWGPNQRDTYGNPVLNRHLILHGESKNHGTELISLRALSHLAYVSEVLARFPS